jgi:glycosyltransferase involved in cell wall biosynthesis
VEALFLAIKYYYTLPAYGGILLKICLTIYSSPWSPHAGGGQLAVHHLACALQKMGHDVHALYSKSPDEKISAKPPYTVHWTSHFNCATLNLDIFSFARALKRLMKWERFDIVHGNAEEAFFASTVARKFSAGYLFTSHANMIPETGMIRGMLRPISFLKSINNYLLRSAAFNASRVITFSEFSKKLVLRGLGKKKGKNVIVVSPGIDPSWFEVIRQREDSKDLVLWGRMEDQKGIPELLRALKEVLGRIPEVRLHLIGEGNMTESYRKQAEDLGVLERVDFHGWMDVEAIQKFTTKCAIGVFPSRIESFGLSMAEAMGAGLPIIASRVGALPEFIVDGVTGSLVAPGNVPALYRAILEKLENADKAQAMADAGRDAVHQRFSWDQSAQKMTEIYQAVLDEI